MPRTRIGDAGLIAGAVSAAAAAGAIAVLTVTLFADHLHAPLDATAALASPSSAVNRDRKRDALAPSTPQTRAEIKSVEVVGIRDAAVVYRDRHGNVLFRTEPAANVTVVAKNVELPQVTIRVNAASPVDPLPVDGAGSSAPPRGCESSFARPAPDAFTRIPSRCVTDAGQATRVATVR